MAKEISCEIVKDYFDVDNGDEYCTKLCEVKWNGRQTKGYDIRKYNKEQDKLFKGITLSYDGFKELIYKAIENGLVDLNEVDERVKKRRSQIIDSDGFKNMFMHMNNEIEKCHMDKYGILRDETGKIVIKSRRKK